MNIVITGGSRGIGLELTKQALEAGDQVLAVARHPESSKGLSELKKKFASHLHTVAADVADPEAPQKILAAAKSVWPHVDILVNNAGMFARGQKPEDFASSFQVNSAAPFLISMALLPELKKSKAPKIVQITSRMGSIDDCSSGGSYAYRASKSALNMLNKCLAVENPWLTTLVMHPGWVKTDMGGSGASVETKDSAAGIWKLARRATTGDSGKFFDFRGESIPW